MLAYCMGGITDSHSSFDEKKQLTMQLILTLSTTSRVNVSTSVLLCKDFSNVFGISYLTLAYKLTYWENVA